MKERHFGFPIMIRLSKCFVSELEKDMISDVLDQEHLGMGSYVKLFEKKLTKFFKNDVATVINGTTGLMLALQAVGVKKGDEVLVQSITYLASFQAISALGAKPIPCDIGEDFTISLNDAATKLTKKTKVIMPVHYAGDPGNLNEIYKFAKKNNLRVVEDAAHAFGSTYKKRVIGSFGDVVCFSFDGIKNITCGEGGCIVSSDKDVIKKIKDSRLLGVENDTDKRYSGQRSWDFDVINQGWRAHLSNINAGIGIVQLKKFKKIKRLRQGLARYYDKCLAEIDGIRKIDRDYDEVVPHIYPVILNEGIDREGLRNYLTQNNIETGAHYLPNHFLTFYGKKKYKLSYTEKIYDRVLTLPLHPTVTRKDIDLICKNISVFLNGS